MIIVCINWREDVGNRGCRDREDMRGVGDRVSGRRKEDPKELEYSQRELKLSSKLRRHPRGKAQANPKRRFLSAAGVERKGEDCWKDVVVEVESTDVLRLLPKQTQEVGDTEASSKQQRKG